MTSMVLALVLAEHDVSTGIFFSFLYIILFFIVVFALDANSNKKEEWWSKSTSFN
jgi:hypothetical protein